MLVVTSAAAVVVVAAAAAAAMITDISSALYITTWSTKCLCQYIGEVMLHTHILFLLVFVLTICDV